LVAVNAGVYFLNPQGGITLQDNLIRLRNYYKWGVRARRLESFENLTRISDAVDFYGQPVPQTNKLFPRWAFAWSVGQRLSSRQAGLFYAHYG